MATPIKLIIITINIEMQIDHPSLKDLNCIRENDLEGVVRQSSKDRQKKLKVKISQKDLPK